MYTDVISLSDAKDFLGVDDESRDKEITRMIDAALRYVEEHTGHIMYARDKTYRLRGRTYKRVYDFPINSVVKGVDKDGVDVALTFGTNYDLCEYEGYTEYYQIDSDAVSLVLNVGYTDVEEIPEPLIEAAYIYIGHLFDGKEGMFPAMHLLGTHKRFII